MKHLSDESQIDFNYKSVSGFQFKLIHRTILCKKCYEEKNRNLLNNGIHTDRRKQSQTTAG